MVLKTKEEARANFEAAVAYIPDRYRMGVEKADWHTPAKSDQAEKNYADAISKAVAEKRRQKAIAAMSNEDWKRAAKKKALPSSETESEQHSTSGWRTGDQYTMQ